MKGGFLDPIAPFYQTKEQKCLKFNIKKRKENSEIMEKIIYKSSKTQKPYVLEFGLYTPKYILIDISHARGKMAVE